MTTPAGAVAAATVVHLRSPARGGCLRRGWRPAPAVVVRRPGRRCATRWRTRSRRRRSRRSHGAWTTGAVASADQVGVPAPGPRAHQPRGQVPAGPRSGPSPAGRRGRTRSASRRAARAGGLGRPADHAARRRRARCDRRRRRCCGGRSRSTRRPSSARLHVTALGLHRVTINGRPVSDDLLAPGWTAYRHRLLADTYDVTAPPAPGRERHRRRRWATAGIAAGWAASPAATAATYGREVGADRPARGAPRGRHRRESSRPTRTWRASTGEIRSADLYDGCAIDLRERQPGWDAPGFDAAGWAPARRAGDRRAADRAAPGAAGAGHRRAAGHPDVDRGPGRDACSTAARTSRATSGSTVRGSRRDRS